MNARLPDSSSQQPRIHDFLNTAFEERVTLDPVRQSYLGRKTAMDRWTDWSDEHAIVVHNLIKRQLSELQHLYSGATLSEQEEISYQLFEYYCERELESFPWRRHHYLVNPMNGLHSWLPGFLITVHLIDSQADAEAYIRRLEGIQPLFLQLLDELRIRDRLNFRPPAFAFPKVISDCQNILHGAPFDENDTDSTLWQDFRTKVMSCTAIPESARESLLQRAKLALLTSVKPAYESLLLFLTEQAKSADDRDGVWKLEQGSDYYHFELRFNNTTRLSSDEIYSLGIGEVQRIHKEMGQILRRVQFRGTLLEFFAAIRNDPRFFLPNTDEGRTQYLERAKAAIREMESQLPRLFLTLPKSRLEIRRVEDWRENSAGKAFYSRGTADGARPGVYFVNLVDMNRMPTYQLEVLAFHEAIPGHHLQLSIAQELVGIPEFRKHASYPAYAEGWGLYSELLPKELGFYADPYADFGRLAMELWRACRLVVDTAIHSRGMTRQQAIQFLLDNTPNPKGDAVNAVERYIVMPGQATSYTIGLLKLLELRSRAQSELGTQFEIRQFHDLILTSGPMPLEILERRVEQWLVRKRPIQP